jgi:guanylate kinase
VGTARRDLGGDVLKGVERKGQGGERLGMGLVFVISAPSGTGKTTLLRRVMEALPDLRFSVSYTTRVPRATEKEGEDYYFVSPGRFREMVEKDEFLEWAEVVGNRYGTTKASLEEFSAEGFDLLLDIDTQGAKRVRERVDHAVLIFILPPSYESLRHRLVTRGLDSPEAIRSRLASARAEIREAHRYHYVIVNERVEKAVETLVAIVIAERARQNKERILKERETEWEEGYGKDYR